MKIYEKGENGFATKDSAYISKRYNEIAVKIANIISQVDDMKSTACYLSQLTHDNADPEISLTESVEKLGIALADCVTYCKEYTDEAEGKENDDET